MTEATPYQPEQVGQLPAIQEVSDMLQQFPELADHNEATDKMFVDAIAVLPENHQTWASMGMGIMMSIASGRLPGEAGSVGSFDIIDKLQNAADADPVMFVAKAIIAFLLISGAFGLGNAKHITRSSDKDWKTSLGWFAFFGAGAFIAYTQIGKFFADVPGGTANVMTTVERIARAAVNGGNQVVEFLNQIASMLN